MLCLPSSDACYCQVDAAHAETMGRVLARAQLDRGAIRSTPHSGQCTSRQPLLHAGAFPCTHIPCVSCKWHQRSRMPASSCAVHFPGQSHGPRDDPPPVHGLTAHVNASVCKCTPQHTHTHTKPGLSPAQHICKGKEVAQRHSLLTTPAPHSMYSVGTRVSRPRVKAPQPSVCTRAHAQLCQTRYASKGGPVGSQHTACLIPPRLCMGTSKQDHPAPHTHSISAPPLAGASHTAGGRDWGQQWRMLGGSAANHTAPLLCTKASTRLCQDSTCQCCNRVRAKREGALLLVATAGGRQQSPSNSTPHTSGLVT